MTFNNLNKVFFSKINELFEKKEGKKIIKEYVSLIKNDPILKKQFEIFTQIEEGISENFKSNNVLVEKYVNTILEQFKPYSKKNIIESNKKLETFLKNKNFDLQNNTLNEDNILISIEYLIQENNSMSNIEKFIEVKDYLINEIRVKENVPNKINEDIELDVLIEEFNEKYKDKLNEEEIKFINTLILPNNKEELNHLIKESQQECINKLNSILVECVDIEIKDKLLQLKEKVLFESIVDNPIQTIVELNEISSVIDEIIL